jgi:hypothetical protein
MGVPQGTRLLVESEREALLGKHKTIMVHGLVPDRHFSLARVTFSPSSVRRIPAASDVAPGSPGRRAR